MNELKESHFLTVPKDNPQHFILRSIQSPSKTIAELPLDLTWGSSTQSESSRIVFNTDSKVYTPAFISASDQLLLQQSDVSMKESFQDRVRQSFGGLRQLANRQKKYCGVCHEHFTHYKKHISHPVHLKRIAISQGQAYINELVLSFRKKSSKSDKNVSEKDNSATKLSKVQSKQQIKQQIKIQGKFVFNQSNSLSSIEQ